jgi:Fe-S cluster assembly protein SufD
MAILKISESQVIRITANNEQIFEVVSGKKIRLGIILELMDQHINYSITLKALQQNCEAEVRIISLLKNSSLELSGTLVVEQGAIDSNLYLSHKTLLLDTVSNVQTKPQLVLSETDIKCGHGATVSMVSAEQIDYLQTRGITRQNAETMLCYSQIDQVCEWVLTKSDVVH